MKLLKRIEEQITATGFLRNGMVNEEGAIIPEQFRIEGMFDRMDAVGSSVLGLSLKCAQCHTHKFDPITHTEFYGMMAFLNNADEPDYDVPDPALAAQHEQNLARESEARLQAEAQAKLAEDSLAQQEQALAAAAKARAEAAASDRRDRLLLRR